MNPPLPSTPIGALLGRRVLFVGGKGGVGKTTVAAALAVMAAGAGRRCLVVSTDPAHSLGDVFGRSIGSGETPLAEGLWGLEIDPEAEAARHITAVKQQMKGLVHPRMYEAVDRQLDLARFAPGTAEAALLDRVADLMLDDGRRFDLVLFDTAPTGHTLRLLSLPEIMNTWIDGLLRHRERASTLESLLKRFGGHGDARGEPPAGEGGPPRDDTGSARLREILVGRQQKFGRARARLLDAGVTAFILVLGPDKLSILESRRALESLARAHVPVAALIVNRVLPEAAEGEFLEARRRQEAAYLEAIGREFGAYPRRVLPLLTGDVQGLAALGEVGRLLVDATS